jgi:integrase
VVGQTGESTMSVTKRVRYKNGKKKTFYHAEVYVRGVRLADQIFDTQAAAHKWHDEEKCKLIDNPNRATVHEELFSDCLAQYFEWGKARLKISTQQNYSGRLPYFTESFLYKLKVKDINSEMVDRWLSWLVKHPASKSKNRKSFDKELKTLSVVLHWYRNYINANYIVPITKRHREKAQYKPLPPRRPDYFARPEEIRAWIDWLKAHRSPVYGDLATFMILTGCRVGEACALKWDMVDFKMKFARISRTVHWDYKTRKPSLQDSTKTDESSRIVILSETLLDLLCLIKLRNEASDIVFPDRKGGFLKYNAVQSAFNAGFKAMNLPWRSTHICRHTYATMALFATRDITSVQASLGHKKRDMTEKYAKAVALLSSGTAEKTAAVFNLNVGAGRNHVQNHVLEDFRGYDVK